MDDRKPTDSAERRISFRKPLRTPVAVSLRGSGGFIRARSLDLSSDGLGLVMEASLPKGTLCRVHFNLGFRDGSQAAVVAEASIAYCVLSQEHDGFKTGAAFQDLTAESRAALQRFLSR